MKIVTAIFAPEDIENAIDHLINNNVPRENLSLVSSAGAMPAYLEGKPEKSAASGALLGAVSGGTVGALGSVAVANIAGFESESLLVSGLMATAVSSIIGGYLGSLYSVRADTQTQIDVHEELEAGNVLLLIEVPEAQAEAVKEILAKTEGEHAQIHTVPEQAKNEDTARQKATNL